MSANNNNTPKFIRTKQDAVKVAEVYEQTKNDAMQQQAGHKEFFSTVQPPFKCVACKKESKTEAGYDVASEILCERCVQAAIRHGYQQLSSSEALTGQKLMSDEIRAIGKYFSGQVPPTN